MRVDPILVVARTLDEADRFSVTFGLERGHWLYVTRHLLKGRHQPRVFLVDDYWENPDWPAIEAALRPCLPRAFEVRQWT